MKRTKLIYDVRTWGGNWVRHSYVPQDEADLKRSLSILKNKPDEYRLVEIKQIQKGDLSR